MKLHAQFEDRIHRETWAKGHFSVRIPTGARIIGRGRMLPVKTPFDFACSVHGQAVFFDAKSTENKAFNIATFATATGKVHQFNALMAAHTAGAIAGYLIWFIAMRRIVWAPIDLVAHPEIVSIRPEQEGCFTIEDHWVIDLAELCDVPRRTKGRI